MVEIDMRDFDIKAEKFVRNFEGDVSKTVRAITFDLFARVRKLAPVDTGRYRAAWNIGVSQPDLRTPPIPNQGERVTAQPPPRLGGLPKFPVLWLTNNLPYAEPLENGHSKRRPEGVMRAALAQAGYGQNVKTLLIGQ